jgi:glycosyltransferase 2 family protein
LSASSPPSSGQRLLNLLAHYFKRYKLLVRLIVLALIAVFLGAGVWKSWSTLSQYHWDVQWWLFLAAFLLLIGQELSYAFIWRSILARLGSRLDIVSSQRIYLGAEFVRYIPGNVWHVITRVLWAEQRGVPKSVGLASMVIELATKITSAALVFVLSLFFWPNVGALTSRIDIPHGVLVTSGALLIPLLLAGLYPPLLQTLLNLALRRLGREPVSITMRYLDLLLITCYWMLSWLIAGAGFCLLIDSIAGVTVAPTSLALAIGIYAIAWDVGFLSFVTPSGLGFREAAMILLLTASNLVPSLAIATVLAFITRLLSTGSELICIAIAHLAPGAPVPPVELAQRARAELP